jgi:hypothetical protein
MSPAQHQVRHCVAIKHHVKNYGSVSAIRDRMLETLYIPKSHENLMFGVPFGMGKPLAQRYPTGRGVGQSCRTCPPHGHWPAAYVEADDSGGSATAEPSCLRIFPATVSGCGCSLRPSALPLPPCLSGRSGRSAAPSDRRHHRQARHGRRRCPSTSFPKRLIYIGYYAEVSFVS